MADGFPIPEHTKEQARQGVMLQAKAKILNRPHATDEETEIFLRKLGVWDFIENCIAFQASLMADAQFARNSLNRMTFNEGST